MKNSVRLALLSILRTLKPDSFRKARAMDRSIKLLSLTSDDQELMEQIQEDVEAFNMRRGDPDAVDERLRARRKLKDRDDALGKRDIPIDCSAERAREVVELLDEAIKATPPPGDLVERFVEGLDELVDIRDRDSKKA